MKKPYKVGRSFRTNEMSFVPGGCTVIVELNNGQVLEYDKIKYPQNYIKKVMEKDDVIKAYIKTN